MLADSSGRTRHRSACHPRSNICWIPAAIPARIFSASSPGGNEGSEKSTVSGSWPTNNTRFIFMPSISHLASANYHDPSAVVLLLVLIGIGRGLTTPLLPHHRAYGSRTTAVQVQHIPHAASSGSPKSLKYLFGKAR